jgi:D-serine deaminase-like pyridoxal phosphate-dependent protein
VRVEELDTPCLVVDLEQMERNLDDMAGAAKRAGVGLRPHGKTHKSPELAKRQMALGAIGLTLAKIGEAEVFADGGLAHVETLIAYSIVGQLKLRRLMDLAERAKLMVSLDDLEVARPLGAAARERGLEIGVLLEVDTGIKRMGVQPRAAAVEPYRRIGALPGIRLRGIMTHEGQSYGPSDPGVRQALVDEAGAMMVETAEHLRRAGLECEIVSMGSTPAAKLAMLVPGVTEIRPGTYIFYDANQIRMGICTEDQASATVHATVVSHAARDRAVLDAGSKAITQDGPMAGGKGLGLVKGMPGWRLDRAWEEHGVIVLQGEAPDVRIGQRLELIPNHICPVVNLFDHMYLARGGEVVETLPVAARGRSQ